MGDKTHIIATLGTLENKMQSVKYRSKIDLLTIKENCYQNSTKCLLDNYAMATFTLIGTEKSIDDNKAFVKNDDDKVEFKKVKEIEDIFKEVLTSIEKNAKRENIKDIILDVTHGFRTQPLVASFASILGQINYGKTIHIIYAQQEENANEYSYISLEKYVEESLISLQLQSFHQKLVIPNIPIPNIPKSPAHPLIESLGLFSSHLHANDFKALFNELERVNERLDSALRKLESLENILLKVKEIIKKFNNIKEIKEQWKQYYKLAFLMNEKGYFLISATYAYEAIPMYVYSLLEKEGDILNPNLPNTKSKKYIEKQAVKQLIFSGQFEDEKGVFIDKAKALLLIRRLPYFSALRENMEKLNDARNNAAHINTKDNVNLKATLQITLKFLNFLKEQKNIQ